MSSRATAILVAVAVVAGITIAAFGLATQGSSKQKRVLQVDEQRGRVGRIALGETRADVVGTLGEPQRVGAALLYPHLTVRLRDSKVVSIATDDPAARTEKSVRMGDPLSAVRASYRKAAKCVPNSPDKSDPHPRCTVRVAAGRLLVRGDPVRLLVLARR
jgi:hypothetical protein